MLSLSSLLRRGAFIMLAMGCAFAGEMPPGKPAYPLWDGVENVEHYAKRVNLPPTQSLDLGGGVKLELVLIPAGKFVMGTPKPMPVNEADYRRQIVKGQALLVVSAVALLVMLVLVIIRAVRQKRRPQLSLGRLLLVTIASGGCALSYMHLRYSAQTLEAANAEYAAAKVRYNSENHLERPARLVTVTKPFYLGRFVVTQEQCQAVFGDNLSHFKGMDKPLDSVSWDEAQVFCKKLSEQTKQTVRLPTEAEWEFACRAGTTTTYHSGNEESDLARVAWYKENSEKTTHPVGQKEANAFGLYDMHGNVWQWCQDRYSDDYSEAENPQGPEKGAFRLLRGGCWFYSSSWCRSATRFAGYPNTREPFNGFRVVVNVAGVQ